jgi:hypothetical protein
VAVSEAFAAMALADSCPGEGCSGSAPPVKAPFPTVPGVRYCSLRQDRPHSRTCSRHGLVGETVESFTSCGMRCRR